MKRALAAASTAIRALTGTTRSVMVQAPIFVVTTDPNVQTPAGAKKTNSEHATFVALAVAFEYSDTAFVERFLPWVRFACFWLQRDHSGVVALVRDMVRQGGEVRLDEAEAAWASCAEMFSAINEFVESAKVRLSIVRAQIQDEKAERASQMSASEQASAVAHLFPNLSSAELSQALQVATSVAERKAVSAKH